MAQKGVDYESLPGSLGSTPKHPLSKSLSRSASNRAMIQQQRDPNPDPYHIPQRSPTPKTLFSLHTTPPSDRPPPPPIAKSKLLSRSLTFGNQNNTSDPAPSATKSFLRSSTFAQKEQPGFSITRSLSRSWSSLSSHDHEHGLSSDSFSDSFSKWFRSKPVETSNNVDIPESSPYSLFSSGSSSSSSSSSNKRASSSRVFPIGELESSFGVLTKGFLDSSKNAVKAVQDKARHLVSQNHQRHQDGGLHLDMVYITESIIAVGFPGADTNSNILGFTEANNQDLVEELITFCEAEHPGRYTIFNLCSEKLYDTSLLHDKVACFPFQGSSNCPPLQLVSAFCEAAYAWLKEGLENVVVVHCKGGMARTGFMISCLLLHLKFYPTAEESMNHYNQKRSADSNGLHLPSQLRYMKYYEKVLRKHHGYTPTGRRCVLRSIRLINCPTWICPAVTVSDHDGVLFRSTKHPKTRSMLTEDLWLSAIRKGEFVFELPDDGHAATVDGDFKIQFQCYHVDFACWLNTNLMEGNFVLWANDLDGFDKGLLQEAVGFQVQLELVDLNSPILKAISMGGSAPLSLRSRVPSDSAAGRTSSCTDPNADEEINVFSDSEGEEESPGISARPSTEACQQSDTLRYEADDTTSHTPFQTTLFSAVVPEISTGILNAMDRLGMTHFRGYTKSASMPNSSSRIASADRRYATHGSAWSVDYGKDGWLNHGSSRFHCSKEELQENDVERDEPIGTVSYIPGKVIVSGPLNSGSENPGASCSSEDPRNCSLISDPSSDFQALAAASAADASLFTFVDEEDYESDEV